VRPLHHRRSRRLAASVAASGALILAAVITAPVSALSTTAIGPSSATAPYVLPVADGIHITSVLTVADAGSASNGYEMVGVPDGMGIIRQGANLVLYVNHELSDAQGIVRRHGQRGAFVSRWVINPATLEVKEGSDWINPGVQYWDYPSGTYVTSGARFANGATQDLTFGRFCSGTLSDPGVFYNGTTRRGWKGQIYFGNEEDGDAGRVFGITKEGNAIALPRLGLASWENTKPARNATDTTLVIGTEDGPTDGSQLWVHVGTKQRSGSPTTKAGLMNGTEYVIDANNAAVTNDAQWRATYGKATAAVHIAAVDWNQSGAALNVQAKANGLSLNRIEDGHWDPGKRNDFYFVTTQGGVTGCSGIDAFDTGGLWRLSFANIDNPSAGATLTLLLDGSETIPGESAKFNKPDNLAIDTHGNVLIQEDPGIANHVARIVAYRIADGALGVVARFDTILFGPGSTGDPARLTIDEESSGIIDAEAFLGRGSFVFDAQVHTVKGLPAGTGPNTVQEYVARGQILTMKVDDWAAVYGGG
jgi:hypothetical protein